VLIFNRPDGDISREDLKLAIRVYLLMITLVMQYISNTSSRAC